MENQSIIDDYFDPDKGVGTEPLSKSFETDEVPVLKQMLPEPQRGPEPPETAPEPPLEPLANHIEVGQDKITVQRPLNAMGSALFMSALSRLQRELPGVETEKQLWIREFKLANSVSMTREDIDSDPDAADLAEKHGITDEHFAKATDGIVHLVRTPSQAERDQFAFARIWDTLSDVVWGMLAVITTAKADLKDAKKSGRLRQYLHETAVDLEAEATQEQMEELLNYVFRYAEEALGNPKETGEQPPRNN